MMEYYECPSPKHSQPGQHIELGTCIGFAIEPSMRSGRLVGIVHNPKQEMFRYIIRKFKEGDVAFPTGDYITMSKPFLIPHYNEGR